MAFAFFEFPGTADAACDSYEVGRLAGVSKEKPWNRFSDHLHARRE